MKIMIIAGEASGDLHGSFLVKSLKERRPDLEFYGIGGRKMQEVGVRLMFDIRDMAVVGLFEVFEKIGTISRVYRKIVSEIKKKEATAVILIDYPTFNLRIAEVAKKNGIPVIYFIGPQLWAWRMGRIKKIARIVDKMIVIFPFEEKIYQDAGMDVSFVGHPFLDIVKTNLSSKEIKEKFHFDPKRKIIGLMPGSRKKEIDYLLPSMLKSAKLIKNKDPQIQFILLLSEFIEKDYVEEMVKKEGVEVRIISGNTYELISVSDLIIVASGSATLEVGLLTVPMVIVYRVNYFTYRLAKWLVRIKHIGLVNIVSGGLIVPELLQDQVNPEEISKCSLKIMEDGNYYDRIKADLKALRTSLGDPGAPARAAQAIIKKLEKNNL